MLGIRNWLKICLTPWTTDQMPLHTPLHYELTGNPSNPVVVLLHGFMGSSKDWHEIIDLLVDSCLCLAIDLPGHGKSTCLKNPGAYTFSETAAQVVSVMEMTKAVPATVMGYSMGGRIALYVALQYRHACSKLVIESATAGIVDEGERAKRKALDRDRAQEISRGKFEDFVRTWYCQPVFQTLAENPERLETVIGQRLLNDPLELSQALDGMGVGMQPSLWGRLHELPIPTLLIAGEKDSKYVGIVQSMAALIPKGRVVSIPETGHNAHLENPDLVAEYTKDFILKE
jgi:2-succinyl-6-hydroxy-2,4-cyclohexadiene-1-carboxylate synthase